MQRDYELKTKLKAPRAVSIRAPLWALLEAIDSLEPQELQQIARHVRERLSASGHAQTDSKVKPACFAGASM